MSKYIIIQLSENEENQLTANLFLKEGDVKKTVNNLSLPIPSSNSILNYLNDWRNEYIKMGGMKGLQDKEEEDDDDDKQPPIQKNAIYSENEFVISCIKQANLFNNKFQQWLNSNDFAPIKQQIEDELRTSDPVQVLIETNNLLLWRLPWHLWDVLNGVEVALSYTETKQIKRPHFKRKEVRILAIFGNDQDIKGSIKDDRDLLQKLPNVKIEFLDKPSRSELYEKLWDFVGWDILFFSGHSDSYSDLNKGFIDFNDTERISIGELKEALRTSIGLGLKLAIFNSCDGLGLVNEFANLCIPQLIVMREKVVDVVAHEFIRTFFTEYSQGKSLYESVKKAREKLLQLEGANEKYKQTYPCASWLPVICQNPTDLPTKWLDFLGKGENQEITWQGSLRAMLDIATINRLKKNFLVREKEVGYESQEIYIPLGLVGKKTQTKSDHTEKDSDSPEDAKNNQQSQQNAEEISDIYAQQERFFKEVLTEGKSRISQGKRILIIGEGGAGKSTFLRKIASWVFENSDEMAIWVSLADLGDLTFQKDLDEKALEKYLQECFAENKQKICFPGDNFEDFEKLFPTGKVWLLLDAVDEMRTTTNGLFVLSKLLTDWMKQGRVVITCRLNVWEQGKQHVDDFDTYRLLELNYSRNSQEDQVGQFIKRYFIRYGSENNQGKEEVTIHAEKLRNQLDESGRIRIRELVRNPLRLSLLCAAYDYDVDKELPKTKAGLYEELATSVYKWYNEKRRSEEPDRTEETLQVVSENQEKELNSALAKLALRGIEENLFQLPYDIVEAELGVLLEKALQVGWLNQVGVSKNQKIYTFYHRSFQDYFAALAIDDGRFFLNHDNEKINPLLDPNPALEYNNGKPSYRLFNPQFQWQEVYVLWLGRNDVEGSEEQSFRDSKYSLLGSLWFFNDGCQKTYSWQSKYLLALGCSEFTSAHIFPPDQDEELNKSITFITQQFANYKFGFFDEEQNDWMGYIQPMKEVATLALKEIEPQVVMRALMKTIEERRQHSTYFLDVIGFIFNIDPNLQILPQEYNEIIIKHLVYILEKPDNEYGVIGNIIAYLQKLNPEGNLLTDRVVNGLLTSLDNYKHDDRRFRIYRYENYLKAIIDNQRDFQQIIFNRLTNILLDPQPNEFNHRLKLSSFLEENAKGNSLVISKLLNWFLEYWQNFQVEYWQNFQESEEDISWSSPEGKEEYRLVEQYYRLVSLASTVSHILRYTANNDDGTIERLIETANSNSYNVRAKFKLLDLLFFIGRTNDHFKQFLFKFIENDRIDSKLYRHVIYKLGQLVELSSKQKEKGKPEYLSAEEKEQIINLLLPRLEEEHLDTDLKTIIIETLPIIDPKQMNILVNEFLKPDIDSYFRRYLGKVLEKQAVGNIDPKQMNILVSEFLKPDIDSYFRRYLGKVLEKQAVGNQEVINILVNQFLKNYLDKSIYRPDIRDVLIKIGVDNEAAINTLINQLTPYKSYSSYSYRLDEQINHEIIIILGKIIKTNEKGINGLAEILGYSNIDKHLKKRIKVIIEKIERGKEKAVQHLISLVPQLHE